jgi:septation ring formation regulator EzrA
MRKEVTMSNKMHLQMKNLVKELQELWSWKQFYEKSSKVVVKSYNKRKKKMVNVSHYQPRFVELMQVAEKQIVAKQKELDEFKAARSNGKGGKR